MVDLSMAMLNNQMVYNIHYNIVLLYIYMILNEYETNSQCFCWRFQSNQLLIQKIWGNLEIFNTVQV